MSVDTHVVAESLEGATARRLSKSKVLVLVVAFGLTAACGYLAPRAYDWVTLDKSARSVAKTVGCTSFTGETQHRNGPTRYKDAGSCLLNGAQLKIVTFASTQDGRVFDQLLAIRIHENLAKGRTASFASGRGWNVSDTSFTRAVAQDIVRRMGSGAVKRVVGGSNAKAAPTPSAASPSGARPR